MTDESSDDQLSPPRTIYRRGRPEGCLGRMQGGGTRTQEERPQLGRVGVGHVEATPSAIGMWVSDHPSAGCCSNRKRGQHMDNDGC